MRSDIQRCLLGVTLTTIAVPSTARADVDAREIVPASACEPINSASHAKIELISHAWQFVAGESGTATLRCPIRTSFFRIDSNQNTVDVDVQGLHLWFMDPDTTGSTYSITARLYRVLKTDGATGVSVSDADLTSNDPDYVETGDNYKAECVVGTCVAQDMLDAQYYVRIVMTRNSTSLNPRFTATGLTIAPPG